jgi:Family of unknown function (DUF1028)
VNERTANALRLPYPSVGMRVPFAEPGIGAIATQATAERSFGPCGLRMLRDGMSAQRGCRHADHGRDPFLDRLPEAMMPAAPAVRARLRGPGT